MAPTPAPTTNAATPAPTLDVRRSRLKLSESNVNMCSTVLDRASRARMFALERLSAPGLMRNCSCWGAARMFHHLRRMKISSAESDTFFCF